MNFKEAVELVEAAKCAEGAMRALRMTHKQASEIVADNKIDATLIEPRDKAMTDIRMSSAFAIGYAWARLKGKNRKRFKRWLNNNEWAFDGFSFHGLLK